MVFPLPALWASAGVRQPDTQRGCHPSSPTFLSLPGLPASHPVAGRARANIRAPSWAVGDAPRRCGLPRKGIPEEAIVVTSPVVVIGLSVPRSRFPILELALATGGDSGLWSAGWLFARPLPPPPSTSAIGIRGTPGQAESLENRRRWA